MAIPIKSQKNKTKMMKTKLRKRKRKILMPYYKMRRES